MREAENGEPILEQCQWCYVVQSSKFNISNIKGSSRLTKKTRTSSRSQKGGKMTSANVTQYRIEQAGLIFSGCPDHPDGTNRSCVKIRRADGTRLQTSEIWEVIQRLEKENKRLAAAIYENTT